MEKHGQKEYGRRLEQVFRWRIKYIRNTIDKNTRNTYTKMGVGPPKYLEEEVAEAWWRKINECKEICRKTLLIPWLLKKTEREQVRMWKVEAEKKVKHYEIGSQIQTVVRKHPTWIIAVAKLQECIAPPPTPPPPPPPPRNIPSPQPTTTHWTAQRPEATKKKTGPEMMEKETNRKEPEEAKDKQKERGGEEEAPEQETAEEWRNTEGGRTRVEKEEELRDEEERTSARIEIESVITFDSLEIERYTKEGTNEEEEKKKEYRNKLKRAINKYIRSRGTEGTAHRPKRNKLEKKEETQENTFDYTTETLTQVERKLLNKGKTFCVTDEKIRLDRCKTDFHTYMRRLRLHYQFREMPTLEQEGEKENTRDNARRRARSTYDPEAQNRLLDSLEKDMEMRIAAELKRKRRFKDNIEKEEREALRTLETKIKEKRIVITMADKGGGIVAMDYGTYMDKGTDYIEKKAGAYYKMQKEEKEIVKEMITNRDRITKEMKEKGLIDKKTATFITHQVKEELTGIKFFYKVHKAEKIEDIPVRPVQSAIGSPNHHISLVLADILQPYITDIHIRTFIRDSNHILVKLSDITVDEDNTICTADVSNLYPSIPHDLGMAILRKFIEKNRITDTEDKTDALMLAMRQVIEQNYTRWDGKVYQQHTGVAMGTPVAVAYANIFMNYVDTRIRLKCPYITHFYRYIDDILFILPKNEVENLKGDLEMQDLPTIKFTIEKMDEDGYIPFLDLKISITGERRIATRLYTKKTDRHTYLLPNSFHPTHITRSIPHSVFSRLRRICSEDKTYVEDSKTASEWLYKRGYDKTHVERTSRKLLKENRWTLIKRIEEKHGRGGERKDENPTKIPFIQTFNSSALAMKQIVRESQGKLDEIFKQARVIPRVVYRRPRSIADRLIHPALRGPINSTKRKEGTISKCGETPHRLRCPCNGQHSATMCRMCAHLVPKTAFAEQKIRRDIDCNSKNVIYVLWCAFCNKKYIGETQQKVKERFNQHLGNMAQKTEELYKHFRHHSRHHIRISVLETIEIDEPQYRKTKEASWIKELRTFTPFGFNAKLRESMLEL